MPDSEPAGDIAWLEPYPDSALESIADSAAGPAARYEIREAVQLAFIAAIQHLPPRQRAALLLRDVLGWSARGCSKARSRPSTACCSAPARRWSSGSPPAGRASVQGRATSKACCSSAMFAVGRTPNVDGLVALLKEDAVLTMPPWRQWYQGRAAIRKFFSWTARPGGHGPFRLVPIAANRQPAFAFYSRWQGPEWRSHSIQLLTLQGDSVAAMTSFVAPALFPAFGLPALLPPSPLFSRGIVARRRKVRWLQGMRRPADAGILDSMSRRPGKHNAADTVHYVAAVDGL